MKRALRIVFLCGVIAAFIIPLIAADAQYVGAKKCMICHKSEKRGDQWGTWSNGPHAKAYETLKTDYAKEVAQEMGIADPIKAEQCLKCHVTAFGAPPAKLADSFSKEEGVGCEVCHGPGSIYKSMRIMKALADGTQNPKEVAFMKGSEENCLECHNEESPTYKPFNYEEKWAEISHNYPE